MFFGVIVIAFIVIAIIFIPRTLKLDKEAVAYIQENVPKIVDRWDSKNLIDCASPELLANLKTNQSSDRLFEMFSQLGSFKHLDVPKGTVYSGAYTTQGRYTVGNYSAKADFQNGPATVLIQLLRVGNEWKINGFRINSDVFLPAKSKATNFFLFQNQTN